MKSKVSKFLIYALSDPRTGAIRYVGRSSSGLQRPRTHGTPAAISREGNTYKTNWLKSLLKEKLKPTIEVVEEFPDPTNLDEAEIFWIAQFRSLGFKLTNGSDGGFGAYGLKLSEETKQKISKANKGKKRSKEVCEQLSISITEYYRHNVSKTLGTKRPEDYKIRMAAAKGNGRPFLDENGNRYLTMHEAAVKLGLHHSNICQALKGKRSHVKGHRFRYEGEDFIQWEKSKKWSEIRKQEKAEQYGTKPFVDENNNLYYSFGQAERALGLSHGTVRNILSGKTKKARKHTFKYIDKDRGNL